MQIRVAINNIYFGEEIFYAVAMFIHNFIIREYSLII